MHYMKPKFIQVYMKNTFNFALLSTAVKLKVGATVVKDDKIISYGYNGTPAGWDNECETKEWFDPYFHEGLFEDEIAIDFPYEENGKRYRLKTKPEVLHAERNALDKLAKHSGDGGEGAVLFITHAPCLECAKSIYSAGIKEVYFANTYRSTAGLEFLKKCGIPTIQVTNYGS